MTQNRTEFILKQMIKKAKLKDPCFVYDKSKYHIKRRIIKRIKIVGMYMLDNSITLMNNPFINVLISQ